MSAIESFITSAQAYMDASAFVDFTIAHSSWDEQLAARDRWRAAKQVVIDQGTALAASLERQDIDSSPVTETLAKVDFGGPESLRDQWVRISGALRRIAIRGTLDATAPRASFADIIDGMGTKRRRLVTYLWDDGRMPLRKRRDAIRHVYGQANNDGKFADLVKEANNELARISDEHPYSITTKGENIQLTDLRGEK